MKKLVLYSAIAALMLVISLLATVPIAKFQQEGCNDSSLVWITLGVVLLGGIILGAILIIVREKERKLWTKRK